MPSPPPTSEAVRTHVDARHRHLQRILESHGVLTRSALCDLAGAQHWHTPFSVVVTRAIRSGRLRPLGEELLQSTRTPPPED
jgi:hypothetical protein